MASGKYLTRLITSVFAGRGQRWGAEPPKGAVSRGLSLPLEAWLLQGARLFGFTQPGECCYGRTAGDESYDLGQPIVYIT